MYGNIIIAASRMMSCSAVYGNSKRKFPTYNEKSHYRPVESRLIVCEAHNLIAIVIVFVIF